MKTLSLLLVLVIGTVAYSAGCFDGNGDGHCDNCGGAMYGTYNTYSSPAGYYYSAPAAPVYYSTATTVRVRGRFGFTNTITVPAGSPQPVRMVRGILPGRFWVRYADGSLARHIR